MFVRAANPIWYLPDLIGQPLNDEYYAFFLTNTLPYLPQNVYRDPQGMTVWTGNIVQFFDNGTLPNNLYFDPNLVYRIEIRHGNSQSDQLIYEINDFVPGDNISPNNLVSLFSADNQITNPQFSYINFTSPLSITTSGTYNIAPGWDLVLVGAGTTIVNQLEFSGDEDFVNNPPYALRVANNGWTEAYLRQRFSHNGAIWSGGAVSMSITARAQTTSENVSLVYSPNSPGVPEEIASGTLTTVSYQVLQGAIDLPVSVNSTLSDDAYVDMVINLPPTGTVDLSNIQVIGQSDPLPSDFDPDTDTPAYQQQSYERETDHTFNVYAEQLIVQPKKSILTGWNFSLNPFQFITTTPTLVTNQTQYIADQTIIHQETAASLLSGQGANFQRFSLSVAAVNGVPNNKFALIQYIDPATILPYWGYPLSSVVRASSFSVTPNPIRVKMRLIYRTTLPPTISNTEPIASWAGTDPVFAAGWTEILPKNDPSPTLEEGSGAGNTNYMPLSFDNFQMPNCTSSTMTLAVVVYTIDHLDDTLGDEQGITFDKISLVPNEFAVDASPETYDECLRACQFYYEKSYNSADLPGTITLNGALFREQTTDQPLAVETIPRGFDLPFFTNKRAAPTIAIYSPVTGAANNVRAYLRSSGVALADADATFNSTWTALASPSLKGASYIPTVITPLVSSPGFLLSEGFIQFHYTADARLGV